MLYLRNIIKLLVSWINTNKEDIVCMSSFIFFFFVFTFVGLGIVGAWFWIIEILY